MNNSEYPYVIFDFDGTLADTMTLGFKILGDLAVEMGYDPITTRDFEKLRSMTPLQIIRHYKIPLYKLPRLIGRVRREMSKVSSEIEPIVGIPKLIRQLKEEGFNIGILTSNSIDTVQHFLNRHELEYFDFLYSAKDLLGKGRRLAELLKEKGITDYVYIGDEVRDIEAVRSIDGRIVSVSWGVSSREILEKHQPDFLVDNCDDLLDVLMNEV